MTRSEKLVRLREGSRFEDVPSTIIGEIQADVFPYLGL